MIWLAVMRRSSPLLITSLFLLVALVRRPVPPPVLWFLPPQLFLLRLFLRLAFVILLTRLLPLCRLLLPTLLVILLLCPLLLSRLLPPVILFLFLSLVIC